MLTCEIDCWFASRLRYVYDRDGGDSKQARAAMGGNKRIIRVFHDCSIVRNNPNSLDQHKFCLGFLTKLE
jgi:hypothetical protein